MYSAKSVANKLLELARANNDTLTPMQLIKLVYLCHGWMLGLNGRPLIKDRIEAWVYGPVIPALYQAINKYKSQPVTKPIDGEQSNFDAQENNIIEQVYKIYGKKNGIVLSQLTHLSNSPWSHVWEESGSNASISNDLIEHYFSNLAENPQKKAG